MEEEILSFWERSKKYKFDLIRFDKLKFIVRKLPNGIPVWDDYSPYWGIFFYGHYDMLKIKENDVVLDLGAHVGFFTCKTAQKAKFVIAVEPHLEHFNLLKQNIKINGFDNVVLVNKAVYNKSTDVMLEYKGLGTKISNKGKIRTKAITIDKLLEQLELSADVLKMDIEGAETYCLEGRYLKNVRELMVETEKETLFKIITILKNNGFKISIFKPNYIMIIQKIISNILFFAETEFKSRFGLIKHLIKTRWPETIMLYFKKEIISAFLIYAHNKSLKTFGKQEPNLSKYRI